MAWQGIEGHDDVVARFRRALEQDRLASTFLFVGPAGIGKRSFALKLAQALLCQTRPAALLDPCGRCPGCVQVASQTHPDLELLAKPADKSFIPVSAFIGEGGQRMREGLCRRIALRPFMGGRRVAIIDDADYLNEEGANCLLKTLEEPPPRSILILIGTSADKQLPTIRSRCQIVRFRPLDQDILTRLILEQRLADNEAEARRLAEHSGGSLERAAQLADVRLWSFRAELLGELARPALRSVELAERVLNFVDEAGKEAAARRNRCRQVISFALDFYRQLLRVSTGLEAIGDAELTRVVQAASSARPPDPEMIAACLDRCLEALEQVDRNVHQAILIECWLDDLASLTAPPRPARAG